MFPTSDTQKTKQRNGLYSYMAHTKTLEIRIFGKRGHAGGPQLGSPAVFRFDGETRCFLTILVIWGAVDQVHP